MGSYEFKEHTADVMFIAHGASMSDLLKSSGLAVMDCMVDLKSVSKKVSNSFELVEEKNPESLLFSFLEEIIFLKDAEQVLFSDFSVSIKEEPHSYILKVKCSGEKIDPKKHRLKVDVKAVTLHEFSVRKTSKGYKAQVILDI